MKRQIFKAILTTSTALVLASCGGGGKGSSTPSVLPPVANIPPVFTNSSAEVSVAENTTGEIYTAVATDSDGDSLTYSLSGMDASVLNIGSSTGVVSFNSSPDFEMPLDDGSDNVYNLTVTVSDGTNSTNQTVSISVSDLDDVAPVFTSSMDANVEENYTGIAYSATATDTDSLSSALTYSLSGSDASQFSLELNSGEVRFISPPDYEAPKDKDGDNSYELDVTVSDGTNSTSQLVAINVTNLDEAPPTVKALRPQFANAGDSIEIVAEASDDVGIETYVWTQEDGASLSVTGQNTSTLEFTAPEVNEGFVVIFKITVTDAEGRSASESVEITINPYLQNTTPTMVNVTNATGLAFNEEEPLLLVNGRTVTALDDAGEIEIEVEENGSNLLALTKMDGTPLLVAFMTEPGVQTEVSVRSSADAFVLRSPRLFGLEVTNMAGLSDQIRSHPRYDDLVRVIEERLLTSQCPMSQACNIRGARISEEIAQSLNLENLAVAGE